MTKTSIASASHVVVNGPQKRTVRKFVEIDRTHMNHIKNIIVCLEQLVDLNFKNYIISTKLKSK